MAGQRSDKRRFSGWIEQLEDRRVMSVDPPVDPLPPVDDFLADEPPPVDQHGLGDADFWIDPTLETDLGGYLDQVDQMLTEAHNLTGWFNVQQNYGFTGLGQTIAVIDSGIAWDHFALGGGFGAGQRVVGGWDFTEENDSNPYDDGGSGSHGTHVSGIIGSSASGATGVAPGVDFVGLRVFNDAGQGFFSWIENALRWIHTNRNSFENPITAVNLSLGVSTWNSAAIPAWTTLEDEFAQLEADGIFIAVSAGNSFRNYNAAGLSYPAASQYVVPVMSTNDAGQLSSFSQRLARAIAAPGENIVSTVPDYRGNNNGVADDFGAKSGTSMAAPYVAGASALIRQAMQFVGMTNITQDMIYNHMMATADSFFDSATGQNYSRLNLSRAIDSLMPADDYGSTAAAAHNLGVMAGPMSINGRIGQLTDVDCFSFTAASSGTVTFSATCAAGMTPTWQVSGATATPSAGGVTFSVVAGQTYTVGLSSPGAMGNYALESTFQSAFSFTDWGTVDFSLQNDVSVSGDRWFRVQATRDGFLTVQGAFNAAAGSVTVGLYNSNLQQIATGATSGGQARVDFAAAGGGEYFVRVSGTSSDVDFKLMNLVTQSGATVTALGTTGSDAFAFDAGETHTLTVNGVAYTFAAGAATQFNLDGLGGADTFVFTGSTGNESATIRAGSSTIAGAGYALAAASVETQTFTGGGGVDDATLYDSAGDDTFVSTPTYATLVGAGYSNRVEGFDRVEAVSSMGGGDRASMYDSAGDDIFLVRPEYAYLTGSTFHNVARGFDRVDSYATAGGNDRAFVYDSSGNDTFTAQPESSVLQGESFYHHLWSFEATYAFATAGGRDIAYLYDSAGNDRYVATPGYSAIQGGNFYIFAQAFEEVYAYAAAGGADLATFYDSAGNDSYACSTSGCTARIGTNINAAYSFEDIAINATAGGRDRLDLRGIATVDSFYGRGAGGALTRAGVRTVSAGFDEITLWLAAGATPQIDNDALDYIFSRVGG